LRERLSSAAHGRGWLFVILQVLILGVPFACEAGAASSLFFASSGSDPFCQVKVVSQGKRMVSNTDPAIPSLPRA